MSDNSIWVKSISIEADQDPYVLVEYKNHYLKLTPQQAKQRSWGIFRAIAYAEAEAALFARPGFIIDPQKAQEFGKNLQKFRAQRQPLPEGVKAYLGYTTQLPLVELTIDQCVLQLEISQAREHAEFLIECAESCYYDSLFIRFMSENLEMERSEIAGVLGEFNRFRQQDYLQE